MNKQKKLGQCNKMKKDFDLKDKISNLQLIACG